MTRKEALNRAIEVLSAETKDKEAVELLRDIVDELPLVHWTDKSVRDAVEQFRIDKGRTPTATDFKRAGLPPHPTFKKLYEITLAEWLTENYPEDHPSREQLIEQRVHNFIKEYNSIKPTGPHQYNEQRGPKSLRWQVIASYVNVNTWKDLIKSLELKPYLSPPKHRKKGDFLVRVHLDF